MSISPNHIALVMLLTSLAACATPREPGGEPAAESVEPKSPDFVELERGDWVRTHTKYVEREETLNGKPMTVYSPAEDAEEVIVTAEEADRISERETPKALLGIRVSPPSLSETDSIGLTVGEIVEFRAAESEVRKVELAGDAVKAWWTVPFSVNSADEGRQKSTLFFQGQKEGSATLRVTGPDGPRLVDITVTESPTDS